MRIEVDPDVLLQSGQRLASIGSQLGMLSGALGEALGSGIASGMDPAGANFGFKYGRQAQSFADALAKATDAHNVVGYMLEATGYTYENADAVSTIGGSGPAGGLSGQPDRTAAGNAPTGPSGAVIAPPTKWAIIQPFLGALMSWPSGNPSLLRVTAAQWRNLAIGTSAFDGDMTALKDAVSQQEIPESGRITQALSDLADGVTKLSDTAKEIAQSIDDFAGGVQDTQDAIRRLMDRISLDGLWDTVTGFLTGDGDDILREVAHDVGEVLENFQNQVKGVVGLLEELTIALGAAADAFQKWIRPILVETFGYGAGNALADYVTLQTDFSVGAVTGLINTVSGVVSLADIDTWKGMAELAASVAVDPSTLPGVLANMGKEFVAWDKWSGDHPGRAAGEAAFNIGLLFVPGGTLSKSGSVAKSLSYTSRLFEEGRLPRFSDLPGLGGANRDLPGLDGLPGAGAGLPNVLEFRPGPVPDSLVGPTAPHGIDAPTSPASLGGPGGPPGPPGNPVGPNGHGSGGGGDGPPPDAPGRPVGAPESGPGDVDAPASQSPGISEPSTPSHAPSPSDPAAPVSQHAPESTSLAGAHDAGPSPSDPASTSTEHAPAEQRHSGDYDAPSERHQSSSENWGGHSDEHPPAPADHQPARTPAVEHPGDHERPATDGRPAREQPTGGGDGRGHDPAQTTPGVMTGAGMPMSHAPGGLHNSVDGQHASGKTQTPEAPTRGTDAKGAQHGSPESPRAHAPAGAGPGPGNAPAAPVNPAAGPTAAGDAGKPANSGAEPPRGPASEAPAAASRDSGGSGDGRDRQDRATDSSNRASENVAPNGPHSGDYSQQPADTSDSRTDSIPPEDVPPPLVRDTPYQELGGIEPQYVGEQYPGGPMGSPGVTYLDDAARESYRVTIRDGIVYDADGIPFDTSTGVSAFGASSNGRAIFVMDGHGNLYASLEQSYRRFHHSSFFGGDEVAAAGELIVTDGRIELITDHSGHYKPDRLRTQQVLDQLASQGIIIDPRNVDYWA